MNSGGTGQSRAPSKSRPQSHFLTSDKNRNMFAAISRTEKLWTLGVGGIRVLSADEVAKFKLCSPDNGSGTKFVPYQDYRSGGGASDKNPQQFVALDPSGVVETDYSPLRFCSNPTW